ncbi:MAG: hypothetical protein ACXWNC_07275 [Anaerolineales bacterium]
MFVGSWLSLIPWGFVGLGIGYWGQKREGMINGSCYGFALAFVFMITGYSGSASLVSRLPFFAILGIFGGLCGLILGLAGSVIHGLVIQRNKRIDA